MRRRRRGRGRVNHAVTITGYWSHQPSFSLTDEVCLGQRVVDAKVVHEEGDDLGGDLQGEVALILAARCGVHVDLRSHQHAGHVSMEDSTEE